MPTNSRPPPFHVSMNAVMMWVATANSILAALDGANTTKEANDADNG